MIILTKLLLAHIIGDFFLQKKEWVEQKKVRKWKAPFLYIHCLFHFLLIIFLFWDVGVWPAALFVAGLHLVIDGSKLSLQNSKNEPAWFIGDQIAHLAIIVATWFLFWDVTGFAIPGKIFWIIITAGLFLTIPVSVIIDQIMNEIQKSSRELKTSVGSISHYIGILERILILISILINEFQIIGFLLAAKAVFRFSEKTNKFDRKNVVELYFIGTMISFLFAISTGLIVLQFLD